MTVRFTVRRLLAAAVVAQPLLVGVNASFHPAMDFTAAGIIDAATADPSRWYVVHLVAAIGALLTTPAVLGLRSLVHDRGRRVANLGVTAGFLAAGVLGIAFGIEASVFRLVAVSGLAEQQGLAVAEAFTAAPEFLAVPIGVLAFTLAGVLLAIALLAARAVPRWQAVLYLVAVLATLGGAPGSAIGPLAFGTTTVAAAFLAKHVVARESDVPLIPVGAGHPSAA